MVVDLFQSCFGFDGEQFVLEHARIEWLKFGDDHLSKTPFTIHEFVAQQHLEKGVTRTGL